ncbi:MalY/PatB family protein [Streptomyces lydicus]|uniref:MalY/PatB family protein n=1 Tax=Streptomyces lydicus TaxID=47763 RepID=UPI0028700391|nr:aminotransferase class I/II-fold pyridoxal phosphate-dependent enzyme [Streptomyces lydicus]
MSSDISPADFVAVDPYRLAQRDGEKWASAGDGMLSSWVADMDFPTAPAIREALMRRADGDLGYPTWFDESRGGPLGEVFAERTLRRYGHRPDPTHTRLFTDINQAMLATLQVATEPGDAVLLHTPACPPFVEVIEKIGRRPLTVPVEEADGGWEFDPARMARAAADGTSGRCRVLFLVNPHNPTGRVFRRDELESLAELVLRNDLLVISDEVHADLTHAPHRHIPFASLGAEIAARTVTLTSGSKAFNLAGIRCAVAHIGPPAVREAVDARRGLLFGQVGVLAVEALKAAWTAGDDWLDEVMAVLARNRRRLAERLPRGIRCRTPEATFLAWLDCRQVGLDADPMPFFRDEAKVLLFSGPAFGASGEGFVRLNFGTSPQILEETLDRMDKALRRRDGD